MTENIIIFISLSIYLYVSFFNFSLVKKPRGRTSAIFLGISYLIVMVYMISDIKSYFNFDSEVLKTTKLIILLSFSVICLFAAIWIKKFRKTIFKTEQKSLFQEQRFRKLLDNIKGVMFVVDKDGVFVEANRASCEHFGFDKDNLIGKSLTDVYSPIVTLLEERLTEVKSKGMFLWEAEHIMKNGRRVYIELNCEIIHLNKEPYIITIAHDISDRKSVEKQVLSAAIEAEEKERNRFAKEIHDGLGPLLSTIKLYVNELAEEDIDTQEKNDFIKYTNDLINEAITSARLISNNITPQVIRDYGLVKSIESFVNKINRTQKIKIHFDSRIEDEKLDKVSQSIIYRIIAELINNTIKHANANEVFIDMVYELNDLHITYGDDGVGFDVNNINELKDTGMGLGNVISRVKSLNGSIVFSSENGTFIDIRIKQ